MPPRPSIGWSGGSRKAAPARRRRRSATRCRHSTCPTSTAASSALTSSPHAVRSRLRSIAATGARSAASASTRWCARTQQVASTGGQIVAVMPERQQFVSDLRATAKAPFLVLTDMDNGYAMSLGLAIWVGDEMQKIIAERHRLPEYQGNDTWTLPNSGDLRGRPGRPYQGAVCRSRLPQADGDRGSARRHAVLNARRRAISAIVKKQHGPLLSKGPCLGVVTVRSVSASCPPSKCSR